MLVGFGLLFEIVIAAIHQPYDSYFATWASVWADGFVFVGVVGEIAFGRMASSFESELTQRSNEDLAAALKSVGEAHGRAAQLEKEAGDARLETEKLRARTAWRTVPAESLAKMRDAALASGLAATLGIFFWGSDPESRYFAKQLSIPFALCKWNVRFIAASYADDTMFDVVIPLDETWNDENIGIMNRVAEAFDAGGLAYSPGTLPKWYASTARGDELTAPFTYIYVGPKLPPVWDDADKAKVAAADAAANRNED